MRFSASGGGDFDPLAAGVHIGVCDMIVDLGVQPSRGAFGPKHEIYIRWQVPSERITYTKNGKELEGPRVVGQTYTASMSTKANLRKMIENWFSKKFDNDGAAEQFDVEKLLGRACQIQVTHSKDGKYANVTGVLALPKGASAPKVENGTLFYDTEHDSTYNQLPEWLQKKIDAQLDAVGGAATHPTQPATTSIQRSSTSTRTTAPTDPESAFADSAAEQEASQQAARRDEFEDEIPF